MKVCERKSPLLNIGFMNLIRQKRLSLRCVPENNFSKFKFLLAFFSFLFYVSGIFFIFVIFFNPSYYEY